MALSRVFGMSNIAALYANALPDLTLAISRGTATTTTSSEADVSTLESSPTNFINSDFRAAAKISREAANNAISALALLQTVRDAYTRIDALLATLESLADSADDSDVSTVDRAILNQQFSNTRDDIDAIANDTEFHNTAILNTNKTFDFSIGTGGTAGDTVSISLISVLSGGLETGLDSADLTTQANAAAATTLITTAQGNLDVRQATVDITATRLTYAARQLARAEEVDSNESQVKRVGVQVPNTVDINIHFAKAAQNLFLVNSNRLVDILA